MVKFSVVIPAYNEAKYICRALSALQQQSFRDFEVIVKDGLSQDDTVNIARKFTKKVFSKRDSSAADARNQGASYARGEVLVFIDADTLLPPDTLGRFSSLLDKPKFVGASCRKVPLSSSILDRVLYEFVNFSTWFGSVLHLGGAHGNLMLIRRDAFEAVGGFDPDIIVAEEQELIRRALRFGKYVFLFSHCVYENPRRVRQWGRLRLYRAWFVGMFKSFKVGRKQKYEKVR
jgi:glycosyltransferase involved in cell wall biosynthesis